LRVERIITADADVDARFELGAALTDQDRAARYRLAAKALDSQALRRRIATVARAANSFFVCHYDNSLKQDCLIWAMIVILTLSNRINLDRGEALPMAFRTFKVFAAFEFENDDFLTASVL